MGQISRKSWEPPLLILIGRSQQADGVLQISDLYFLVSRVGEADVPGQWCEMPGQRKKSQRRAC
jgi:hypothetical protein